MKETAVLEKTAIKYLKHLTDSMRAYLYLLGKITTFQLREIWVQYNKIRHPESPCKEPRMRYSGSGLTSHESY